MILARERRGDEVVFYDEDNRYVGKLQNLGGRWNVGTPGGGWMFPLAGGVATEHEALDLLVQQLRRKSA